VTAVPGATLATHTASRATAVVQGAQMRTLVLDPATARRMLKVGIAVAVKPASSICKRIIIKVVMSVSVPGFQTDVRAPTGPMAIYKTCVAGT